MLIDEWGLPHSEWELVKTSGDLNKFHKIKDYCGWTIKTLSLKYVGYRKPAYANWVEKKLVPQKVDEFAKKLNRDHIISVFPSVKISKNGTLFIGKNRIIIEACSSGMRKLMRKGECEIRLIYDMAMNLKDCWGNPNFFTAEEKQKILSSINKIRKKEVILEWIIGQRNEFIFYKLESLKQSGEILIKKYS